MSVTHEALIRHPFAQGQILEQVAISSSAATEIPHKLGRRAKGVIPFNLNADARIWKPSESDRPTISLMLRASADVVADLWVF